MSDADEWTQGITALLDEYAAIQDDPLYWDAKQGFSLRARKIELEHHFGDKSPRWLRALLSEVGRLQAVADAAREIVALADTPQLARNWATERLQDALAAYERAGEAAPPG